MDARARFASARVARLATVDAGGSPHLVPICFALAGDVVYFAVDQKPKRTAELKRLENLREDPRCCLLADHYSEDWDELWWARADGRGREAVGDERERALALLRERYEQYAQTPPTGTVIAIDVDRWSSWSAKGV